MHEPAILLPSFARPHEVSVDALQLIADAVICTDERGSILLFNHAAQMAFGYSLSEAIGQQVEILLPVSQRENHTSQVQQFAGGKCNVHRLMGSRREVMCRHKNGSEFPSEATISRHIVDGHIVLTVVHHDISQRKQLEFQRDLVAKELDHRIKNIFTVFSSLIYLSAHGAGDVNEFKSTLLKRLNTLSRTQNILQSGGCKSIDFRDILLDEMASYGSDGHNNIIINGPTVSVCPDAAQALAMIFHELATNSTKYGALSNKSGHVSVLYSFIGEGDESTVLIEWREAGGPLVSPPKKVGFGTKLIAQVVKSTFGVDAVLDYLPMGLVCRMQLPRAKVESTIPN